MKIQYRFVYFLFSNEAQPIYDKLGLLGSSSGLTYQHRLLPYIVYAVFPALNVMLYI